VLLASGNEGSLFLGSCDNLASLPDLNEGLNALLLGLTTVVARNQLSQLVLGHAGVLAGDTAFVVSGRLALALANAGLSAASSSLRFPFPYGTSVGGHIQK
jgi:hypothetical protein